MVVVFVPPAGALAPNSRCDLAVRAGRRWSLDVRLAWAYAARALFVLVSDAFDGRVVCDAFVGGGFCATGRRFSAEKPVKPRSERGPCLGL